MVLQRPLFHHFIGLHNDKDLLSTYILLFVLSLLSLHIEFFQANKFKKY